MGIVVKKGPKPVKFRKSRAMKPEVLEAIQQAEQLKGGEYFEWPDAPKSYSVHIAKLRKQGVKVEAYRGLNQQVIVASTLPAEVADADLDESKGQQAPTPTPRAVSKGPAAVAAPPAPTLRAGFKATGEQRKILGKLPIDRARIKRAELTSKLGLQLFPAAAVRDLETEGLVKLSEQFQTNYIELTPMGVQWREATQL